MTAAVKGAIAATLMVAQTAMRPSDARRPKDLMRLTGRVSTTLFVLATLATAACAPRSRGALTIERQGSFAAGGAVVTSQGVFDARAQPATPAGQTLHGDHAYVFYQVPCTHDGCRW